LLAGNLPVQKRISVHVVFMLQSWYLIDHTEGIIIIDE